MATVNSTYTDPNSATLDKSTGAVIDEAMMDALASNFRHIAGSAGYIGCRASTSTSQSVSNNTVTALPLAAESFDSDPNGAMHDTVTNNTRITIRTAGVYHCGAQATPAANTTGFRQSYIRVNGGSTIAFDTRMASTAGGAGSEVSLYCAYSFAANDYIELVVQQASGGALNYDGALSAVKA